jgi:hypothetical protein
MTRPILVSVPWVALTVGEAICRVVTGSWPDWPALLGLTGMAAAASLAICLHYVLNVLRLSSEQRSFEAGRLYEAATRSSRPLLEIERPAGATDAVITHWPGRARLGAHRRPWPPAERESTTDRRPRPSDPKI